MGMISFRHSEEQQKQAKAEEQTQPKPEPVVTTEDTQPKKADKKK